MTESTQHFADLMELSARRLGARCVAASDDFFARKDNLLKPEEPIFIPGKYTDRGKWVDGWESRRKREPGNDWCIVRLGLPGVVRGVVVDTSHFVGNYPEQASIDGCLIDGELPAEQIHGSEPGWNPLLPKTPLKGDFRNVFSVESPLAFSHLRLNIFPDGGVARLRIFGEVLPDWDDLAGRRGLVDLASAAHGALVLDSSDMHFGSRRNLIMPGRAADMRDGWETRRRRGPGHDWCIVRLAARGSIKKAEIDTAHFKGNFPESCSIEVCAAEGRTIDELRRAPDWQPLLERTDLRADERRIFEEELLETPAVDHARLNIFPDGGVSRLRLWGEIADEGWREMGLRALNALPAEKAVEKLRQCCGSRRWAEQLAFHRPFPDVESLCRKADQVWGRLDHEDFLEAFAGHPRIGEKKSQAQSGRANQWSSREQAGAAQAPEAVHAELAEATLAYEKRFGYIFIVCATGKSAAEMLASLRQRLNNAPEAELMTAAEEQRKITQLRLEKLFLP